MDAVICIGLYRSRQCYVPRPLPAPPLEAVELEEILVGHVPADALAASAGSRGPVLHIGGGEP
jgi:hypothetical protein